MSVHHVIVFSHSALSLHRSPTRIVSRMQGSECRKGRFAPTLSSSLLFPLLSLLMLLLLGGLPFANGSCEFPASWTGQWFMYGENGPVTVNSSILDKRTCVERKEDTYVVYESAENCYRCMIINDRHENVIQFREGWCQPDNLNLESMCTVISSDDNLHSMFRLDSRPIPCPFTGAPFTFSYSRGHGECTTPVSQAESCTDESRLLLKYQACPDVHGTESNIEELQCLATWKDGRNKYLVGTLKLFGRSALGNEETYRCFMYEMKPHHQGRVVYELAQSGDPTCNGLTSVSEGSRTIKLTKVEHKEHSRCKYPSWVTQHHDWHSLDGTRSYHFTSRNATLKVISQDNNDDNFHEEKIVCHNLEKLHPNDNAQGHTEKLVAHITSGCDSGYVCMIFHRRDSHVIELQQSNEKATMPEDACTLSDPSTATHTTLITSVLHQRKCPQPGRYAILSTTSRRQRRGRSNPSRAAERRTWQEDDDEEECRNTGIQIGCSSTGQNEMTIDNTCAREEIAYSCHGSWEEKGTWFSIVSQRNSELTAGLGQTFCFSMRMADAADKLPGRAGRLEQREQELWLSKPARTCQRDATDQWIYRLASHGVCEDLTKAASSTATSLLLSRISLILSVGAALRCILLSR